MQKNKDKPKSWLYDTYYREQNKLFQIISETIKMHQDERLNNSKNASIVP